MMASATNTDFEPAIAPFDPQMRLDPPHELAAAARAGVREPQLAAVGAGTIGVMAEAAPGEQLQLQADQLASHLHLRLREVDRRAAALNAQLADQENGLRNARLWFRERQQELTECAAELDRREQEIALREQGQVQAERELAESRRLSAFEVRRQTDAAPTPGCGNSICANKRSSTMRRRMRRSARRWPSGPPASNKPRTAVVPMPSVSIGRSAPYYH